MVPGVTLTEKAELLRNWGYEAIAVFQPLQAWNAEVHTELLSLESQTGIRPVEFVLTDDIYGHAMSDDLELRRRCRDMYREAAAVCAELGAVTEIEYEYGPQNPLPLFDAFQQPDESQKTEFMDFYRELLAVVEDTDGRILLEPLNRYESRYLNRVVDNLEIIDAVAHPNGGLLPDTFHMSLEETDLAESLRLAAERVVHVHLGDSNRLLPGSGHLDWAAIFGALSDIGYDGWVNLECSTEGDPAQTLPATAAFLRRLIAA
nr:sugar phosphate isomerase/epimerase family protein [Subtercola boreus]